MASIQTGSGVPATGGVGVSLYLLLSVHLKAVFLPTLTKNRKEKDKNSEPELFLHFLDFRISVDCTDQSLLHGC